MGKTIALGRGLSSLLKEEIASIDNEFVKIVDIGKIEPDPYQPRKIFDYDSIKELSDSIRNNGLLQPILVTSSIDGKYKIIAGERRFRACKMANINEIPVVIKNLNEQELLQISLIENIQREELSAIDEAEGYARLINEFSYTQEKLAQVVSKSRSYISNMLRLNNLTKNIKDMLNEKLLTMGHARCLIGHKHADDIAKYIIANDLSVRETEVIVKNWEKKDYTKIHIASDRGKRLLQQEGSKSNEMDSLAYAISQKFNIKVTIEDYPNGSGRLILYYDNLESLDNILSRIN